LSWGERRANPQQSAPQSIRGRSEGESLVGRVGVIAVEITLLYQRLIKFLSLRRQQSYQQPDCMSLDDPAQTAAQLIRRNAALDVIHQDTAVVFKTRAKAVVIRRRARLRNLQVVLVQSTPQLLVAAP